MPRVGLYEYRRLLAAASCRLIYLVSWSLLICSISCSRRRSDSHEPEPHRRVRAAASGRRHPAVHGPPEPDPARRGDDRRRGNGGVEVCGVEAHQVRRDGRVDQVRRRRLRDDVCHRELRRQRGGDLPQGPVAHPRCLPLPPAAFPPSAGSPSAPAAATRRRAWA